MKALNRLGTAIALALGLVACKSQPQAISLPKEADGRTFTVHIPEHFSFRQLEFLDASKDSLLITDEHAIPVDKYFRPGQFPRTRISLRLIGNFDGKFPTPANAKGDGRILNGPDGLEARAWIHTSTSPHELGLMHTYLIAGKKRMYQLNEWVPIDKRDAKKLQTLLDQIISSMKIK